MKKKDRKFTEIVEHRGRMQSAANIFRMEMKIIKDVNRKKHLD